MLHACVLVVSTHIIRRVPAPLDQVVQALVTGATAIVILTIQEVVVVAHVLGIHLHLTTVIIANVPVLHLYQEVQHQWEVLI